MRSLQWNQIESSQPEPLSTSEVELISGSNWIRAGWNYWKNRKKKDAWKEILGIEQAY